MLTARVLRRGTESRVARTFYKKEQRSQIKKTKTEIVDSSCAPKDIVKEISHVTESAARREPVERNLLAKFVFGSACFVGIEALHSSAYRALKEKDTEDRRVHYLVNYSRALEASTTKSSSESIMQRVQDWWGTLLPVQKLGYCIIYTNCFVFAMWRFRSPTISTFMYRNFVSGSSTQFSFSSSILSAFSHQGPVHLGLNCFVLHTFLQSKMVHDMMPVELLKFYLQAAIFSSTLGLAFGGAGLGASGVLYAIIGFICALEGENVNFGLLFTNLTVSGKDLPKYLVAFDSLGLLLRSWIIKRFPGFALGHDVHLAGLFFGYFYVTYNEMLLKFKN